MTIGQRIRQLRRRKGWTQSDLAARMESYKHTVSYWEEGKTEPNFYSFVKLCRTLRITMDEFMKGVEVK